MEPLPDPPEAAPPIAPPTVPGALRRENAPLWPGVLGVIGIVFGVLGFLAGVWGALASTILAGVFPMPAAAAEAQAHGRWWKVVSNGAGVALAILLLVGAILLIRRRRRSVGLLVAWSVLRLLWVLGSLAFTILLLREQMHITTKPSGGVPPGFMNAIRNVTIAGIVVWTCALPVFYLIWLARPAIRHTVKEWR